MERILHHLNKINSFFAPIENDNVISSVVYRLLTSYDIKVSSYTVKEYIKSHPDYPKLTSICDFLEYYNITNYPLKLEEFELFDLNRPFIAHITDERGKVILVYKINSQRVIYTDSFYGKKIMSFNDFLHKWKGVVIIIEPDNVSPEYDFKVKRNEAILSRAIVPFSIFILSSAILNNLLQVENIDWTYFVIGLTHIIGLLSSILLFRNEFEIRTKFTEKLCHISTNADCNAITKSNVSKILGNISWADAGIIYFSGGLILLSVFQREIAYSLLKLVSICTIPYPIFSILYQWLKLKTWCPLCLSVQFALIINFIVFISNFKITGVNANVLVNTSLIYSVILLCTLLFKLYKIKTAEKEKLNLELLRFKNNEELFIQNLKNGDRISLPIGGSSFVFGDLSSDTSISIFLSLKCSACSKKFSEIVKLLNNRTMVKIHLIFSPPMDELSAKLLKVLILMIFSDKKSEALELIAAWYKTDHTSKQLILKKIKIPESNEEFDYLIRENSKLFRISKIESVPSVFINGYPLPALYSLRDIVYHVNTIRKMNEMDIHNNV